MAAPNSGQRQGPGISKHTVGAQPRLMEKRNASAIITLPTMKAL